MKRFLIILTALILQGMLFAETVASGSMTVSVLVNPAEYANVGVAVTKPDLDNLPTENNITFELAKSTVSTTTSTGATSSYVIATRTVYLYYYYVGKDNAELTMKAAKPLQITENGTVKSSIDYSIRFSNASDELVVPDTGWDGGKFDVKRITTDTSNTTYGDTASVAVKGKKTTVMTRGVWEITIYTQSLYGRSYSENSVYEGSIIITLKSS